MAAPTSTMIEAKTALVSGLQALAALATVSVEWGHPGPDNVDAEVIIVGRIEPNTQEPSSLGNMTREENYSIHVTINVLKRDTQLAVSTRAVELAGEVRRYLDANPKMGVTRILNADVSEQGLMEAVTPDGRMAAIPLRVAVWARLPKS